MKSNSWESVKKPKHGTSISSNKLFKVNELSARCKQNIVKTNCRKMHIIFKCHYEVYVNVLANWVVNFLLIASIWNQSSQWSWCCSQVDVNLLRKSNLSNQVLRIELMFLNFHFKSGQTEFCQIKYILHYFLLSRYLRKIFSLILF